MNAEGTYFWHILRSFFFSYAFASFPREILCSPTLGVYIISTIILIREYTTKAPKKINYKLPGLLKLKIGGVDKEKKQLSFTISIRPSPLDKKKNSE